MKFASFMCVSFLLAFSWVSAVQAKDEIVLNTGIRDPFTTNTQNGFVDQIVKEAFRRAGLSAKVIVYQNSAKSLSNANVGIDDGVALRIKGLEKKFPNLIRVPELMMENDFIAYSTSDPIVTNDWAALAKSRIAHINGWQIFQNNLKGHQNTTRTKNAQQMFDLLSAKKVDLILYERWQGLWRAQQLGITLKASEPPLAKRQMFMYLNKKHMRLVKKVSGALKAMKKDGTYQEIFNQTLGKLQN